MAVAAAVALALALAFVCGALRRVFVRCSVFLCSWGALGRSQGTLGMLRGLLGTLGSVLGHLLRVWYCMFLCVLMRFCVCFVCVLHNFVCRCTVLRVFACVFECFVLSG